MRSIAFGVVASLVAVLASFPSLANEASPYDLALGEKDLSVGYQGSALGIITPLKYGPFVSFRQGERAYELSWFGGAMSVETPHFGIGSVSDNVLSFAVRTFKGEGRFNWAIGIAQKTYYAKLNSTIMSNTTGAPASAETIKVQTMGVQVAVGHRWQFQNGIVIGADWFDLYVPVMNLESKAAVVDYANDDATRDRVTDAVHVLRKVPTFTLAKIQLAYSF